MTQQESPKGRSGQRPIPDGDGREAAVAAVAAHLVELDEAKQDGDDELWNDICSDGIEVEIGGATWELWFGQDGWTAARPTYEPEFPGESKGFGDGDLMGRVGPATMSPEEVVRRLVTLEFGSFEEN
jgi:hypothetical protein